MAGRTVEVTYSVDQVGPGQLLAPTRMTERSVRSATDRAAMFGLSRRRMADSAVLLRCTESLFAFSHASHWAAGSASAAPTSMTERVSDSSTE